MVSSRINRSPNFHGRVVFAQRSSICRSHQLVSTPTGIVDPDIRNWEKGYEWHKSFAALNRHLWAYWDGEDIDKETGSPHIIAVAWHAFALAEFASTHPEFDDRPSVVVL